MKRVYGTLADGSLIHRYRLGRSDALAAEFLDYGALMCGLSFIGRDGPTPLIVSLPDLDAYQRDPAYLGIVAGRFANRIAGGRYVHAGRSVQLACNEGPNHLHGGMLGLGRRRWQLIDHSDGAQPGLTLAYHSPDGEEGYPGTLDITAQFTLGDDWLELQLTARSDATTPVNLTHHPYFNLGGTERDAGRQQLRIPASRFLPVHDGALIPTGELRDVTGTPFDFRVARALAIADAEMDAQTRHAGGYDHCVVIDEGATPMAELYSPDSGIRMTIESRMPGLQVYGGQGLLRQHPGLNLGICLEPQGFPDAPNHAGFPDCMLRPGDVYRHRIRYRFSH